MNKTYSFDGKVPQVGKDCFIAPSAIVLGDVILGKEVSIWFQTVLRGDVNRINVGDFVNIQDLCMVHVDSHTSTTIGEGVSIGHHVVVHGCVIEPHCLIGMGAIIMDEVVVGENSLVAAGSLLTPGKKFPARSLIQGSPAKVIRSLEPSEIKKYGEHYKSYLKYRERYLNDKDFHSSIVTAT